MTGWFRTDTISVSVKYLTSRKVGIMGREEKIVPRKHDLSTATEEVKELDTQEIGVYMLTGKWWRTDPLDE